jgi:hypothetical protein
MDAEMPTVRDGGVATTPRDAVTEQVRQPRSLEGEAEQLEAPVASSKFAPTLNEAKRDEIAAAMEMEVSRMKLSEGTADREACSERLQVAEAEKEVYEGMRKRNERPSGQISGRMAGRSAYREKPLEGTTCRPSTRRKGRPSAVASEM